MKPTILVTSAAGKTGMSAALQLLEKDYPVRALVRRKDARSQLLHKAGAEVVIGDLHDIDSLREAFRGCQRAYGVPLSRPIRFTSVAVCHCSG